mmetsp:Transcript_44261/g.71162  ORF Transcript_44261/g.71162 Transcript_44261/m.71162 type:complete len:227 (-) Transcript_44261:325-1005(-)
MRDTSSSTAVQPNPTTLQVFKVFLGFHFSICFCWSRSTSRRLSISSVLYSPDATFGVHPCPAATVVPGRVAAGVLARPSSIFASFDTWRVERKRRSARSMSRTFLSRRRARRLRPRSQSLITSSTRSCSISSRCRVSSRSCRFCAASVLCMARNSSRESSRPSADCVWRWSEAWCCLPLPCDCTLRCCSRMRRCWMICAGMSLVLNSARSVTASLRTSDAGITLAV